MAVKTPASHREDAERLAAHASRLFHEDNHDPRLPTLISLGTLHATLAGLPPQPQPVPQPRATARKGVTA